MRIALICMAGAQIPPKKTKPEDSFSRDILKSRENLEMAHALSIARHMRDGGRLAPFLICAKDSPLERMAKAESLPFMDVGGILSPFSLFRLWRWQKKYPRLQILAIGREGLALGHKLYGMRKPESGRLNLAFFLYPPEPGNARDIAPASHCLCGSLFVAEKLGQILEGQDEPASQAGLVECQPGMALEGYNFPPPVYDNDRDFAAGRHFVFGMGQSLEPRSGALLVARAMAAIWQRTDLPPWEVRMFGSGPRFEEILDEARALGVESRLAILSEQPLAQVIRHCHAWLAPGVNPEELPQTLWGGFAGGLPVICSSTALHRQRLHCGEPFTALRVGENNPQEFAKAMIAIMRDSRLRERLGKSGRALAPQVGMEVMAERVCAHLESWMPPAQPADHGKTA